MNDLQAPKKMLWSELTDDEERGYEETRRQIAAALKNSVEGAVLTRANTAPPPRKDRFVDKRTTPGRPPKFRQPASQRREQELAVWASASSAKPIILTKTVSMEPVRTRKRFGGLTLESLMVSKTVAPLTANDAPDDAVADGAATVENAEVGTTIESPTSSASSPKSMLTNLSLSTHDTDDVLEQDMKPPSASNRGHDDWDDDSVHPEEMTESENGELELKTTYDIWFTKPGKGKKLNKQAYEGGMHLIGSFTTISGFFEFHNAIEWSNLPPSSVIAYCKHGIKPIWEDPCNESGGRLVIKEFDKDHTEVMFTKLALGFFGGMIRGWKNYNLISLHIRDSRRSNDIQLWRKSLKYVGPQTRYNLKQDLFSFFGERRLALDFVANAQSLMMNTGAPKQGRVGKHHKEFDNPLDEVFGAGASTCSIEGFAEDRYYDCVIPLQ